MSTLLKVVLTLAVLLPAGGFLAGVLAASGTAPSPRETIVITGDDADRGEPLSTTPGPTTEPRLGVRFTREPRPAPTPAPPPALPVADDEDYEAPQPVVPPPIDVDGADDDDDDGGDDDDADDGGDDGDD